MNETLEVLSHNDMLKQLEEGKKDKKIRDFEDLVKDLEL